MTAQPENQPLPLPNIARPLRPIALPSLRPWAGARLGGGAGEHWVAGPGSMVALDDGRSSTLDELAAAAGEALVGSRGMALLGPRFPLLVKLIDAGDWLSLQVHPSDAIARRLHGPDAVGKAEAWLVLDADPDARLVIGPRAGMAEDEVRAAIDGGLMDRPDCETVSARAGDVFNVAPGTIHAIGAGVFVYEIEQPSDLTYRISDWGRPPVPGRLLHRSEALEAVRPNLRAEHVGDAWQIDEAALTTPQFRLELVGAGGSADRRPAGASPEIVTVVRGQVALEGDGWTMPLALHETAVVPAAIERYAIRGGPESVAAVGSLP